MKRILGSVAVLGLFLGAGVVKAETMKLTGTLADAKCGAGFKNEEAAAKHTAACVVKCCTGGEKALLISGDKTYKLDDKGTTLAKDFADKNKTTKAIVEGDVKGDMITVTSIMAAPEKKG
jgi:hypothetical protein